MRWITIERLLGTNALESALSPKDRLSRAFSFVAHVYVNPPRCLHPSPDRAHAQTLRTKRP